MPTDFRDRFRGCLIGLAVGDAVGTTVEFSPRGSFAPVTDMVGGGPFDLAPGEWTDDTSLALCLAESLVECGGFDAADQMRRYLRWFDDGHLSSNGVCFDIGGTTASALERFRATGEPMSGDTDPWSAGNGSIMRLAPVVLFHAHDRDAALHHAAESSRTTHGAAECLDACRLLAAAILHLLHGENLEGLPAATIAAATTAETKVESPRLRAIAEGDYREKTRDDIRGTGYVVECLEAALWCLHRTPTFEEAILEATNLGDDADTTAAVCGQLAGACYGESRIPVAWRERLARQKVIDALTNGLLAHVEQHAAGATPGDVTGRTP